ncbi:MAG: transposase [Candidatus Brocadia sp.]|nr:MAG: transposase [Candidatus Brocadia sp.]
MDFQEMGLPIIPFKAGAHEYHPKPMVKLLIYGYSYGIRSYRKRERACHHNLSFMWLVSGIQPDYRTIARFRKENKDIQGQKKLQEKVRKISKQLKETGKEKINSTDSDRVNGKSRQGSHAIMNCQISPVKIGVLYLFYSPSQAGQNSFGTVWKQ